MSAGEGKRGHLSPWAVQNSMGLVLLRAYLGSSLKPMAQAYLGL